MMLTTDELAAAARVEDDHARRDTARLAALHALGILDTPPEATFDEITRAAADICGMPIALVSLVDEHRQWFKSSHGLAEMTETPRAISFCSHALGRDAVFEVRDARLDARFADNPMVTGELGVQFYAGAPIVMDSGEHIGTVCVLGRAPNELHPAQARALQGLARTAAAFLLERQLRVAAISALAESEARHRALVEDQTELVALATPNGTLTYVNTAYAKAFGRKPAEMVGGSLLDQVAPDDRAAVWAHLEDVVLRREAARGLHRLRMSGDVTRWIAWTDRPMLGDDGRVVALHLVGRDVTEEQHARQALAESEQRLRRLYESTPAMLHSIDAAGRLLTVSDGWLRLFGYTRDEVIGRKSVDFLTPESRRKAVEVMLPVLFAGGAYDKVEYQALRRDGTLVDVTVSALLERDATGAPLRSLSVIDDVTERKRMAATLQRAHADLDAVVNNVPAMMGYWDAHGMNRYANRDYQAAVGIPLSRIVGRTMREVYALVDPVGHAAVTHRIAKALAGERQDFEHSLLTVTGLRQLHVTYMPRQEVDGASAGFLEFAYDITGRKALELRLADSELRYRALFDNLDTGFALHEIVLDRDGRPVDYTFLAVNKAFEPLVGLAAAELVGKRVTEVLPGVDHEKADWIRRYGSVALGGETVQFEQYSDRLERWFEVVAYRPAPGQFAVLARDVTARRRADLERRLCDERLRLLVDRAHDHALYLMSPDGRIQDWDRSAVRVHGHAAADIVGLHYRTLFPDADAARGDAERQLDDARALGRFETEGWRLRNDGRRFWASVVLTAILDGDGAVLGYAKMTRDLTGARRHKDQLELVAALSPSAILLIDADGRVQFANAPSRALFGGDRDELIGQPFEQLLADSATKAQCALRMSVALQRQGTGTMGLGTQVKVRHRDGTVIGAELRLSGLDTPDGPAVLAAVSEAAGSRRRPAQWPHGLVEQDSVLKE